MTRGERPPLEPGRVYGEIKNAAGATFVMRASAGGHRISVRLHHDEGPEIAIVCWPLNPSQAVTSTTEPGVRIAARTPGETSLERSTRSPPGGTGRRSSHG